MWAAGSTPSSGAGWDALPPTWDWGHQPCCLNCQAGDSDQWGSKGGLGRGRASLGIRIPWAAKKARDAHPLSVYQGQCSWWCPQDPSTLSLWPACSCAGTEQLGLETPLESCPVSLGCLELAVFLVCAAP
uniref:Uncharacterized protein n=1 Tax=Pipistrellus kuhlii TaxID=59472 RepID=A0A7J7VN18_PIPKU|nr:hypothetical protein mPipKuh1_008447 [Pipistrellus kuhlii]